MRVFSHFSLFFEQDLECCGQGVQSWRRCARDGQGPCPFLLLFSAWWMKPFPCWPVSTASRIPPALGVSRSAVPGTHGCGCGVTHPWERDTLLQPQSLPERIPKGRLNDSAPAAPMRMCTSPSPGRLGSPLWVTLGCPMCPLPHGQGPDVP